MFMLGEGFDVGAAGAHGSGLGVLGGVELSRDVIGLGGRGAEVVPDAVEVDALAALHETLLVEAPEGEVPEAVVPGDVVPAGGGGPGCVHDPQAFGPLW